MLREADLDESTKALCAKAITQRSFNTHNDPAYLTDLVERITVNGGTLPGGELAYGLVTGQMTGDALRASIELRKHLQGSHGAVIAGAYARLNAALDGRGAGGSDAAKAAGGAGGNGAGNADNAVSNTNADAVKNAVPGATNAGNAASAAGSVALNATNPAGTTGAAEPAGTTNFIEPADHAAFLNRPNASKAAPQDPARLQAKCDAQLQLALGIEKALAEGTLLAALKPGNPNSLLNAVIDFFAPGEARAAAFPLAEEDPLQAAGSNIKENPKVYYVRGSAPIPPDLEDMLSIWDDPSRLERAPTTKELEESAANWEDLPAELVKISGTHPKFAYQWIYDRYAPLAQKAYEKNGVPVPLTLAMILQESSARPKLKSNLGAYGLMQVMEGTAKELGEKTLKMKHPELLYEWQCFPGVSIYTGTQHYAKVDKMYGMKDKRL